MAHFGLQRNIQPKRTFKNMMHSAPIFWLSFLIIILLAKGTIETFMKERESAKLALDAQTQLTQLNNQQKDLNEKIAYLKTPEGTETELRGIYNAAKPGESVVLIIDPKNPTSTPVQQKSWWQKFLGFFTNQN